MGKNKHYKLPTIGARYPYNIRNQLYQAKIHYIGMTRAGNIGFCIVEFDYLLHLEFLQEWGCELAFQQSASVLMRDLICMGYTFNELAEIWTNMEE